MKAVLKSLSALIFVTFLATTVVAQDQTPVNAAATKKAERGRNFTDKNGDGICDNQLSTDRGNKRGGGCGQGFQHRHGNGNSKGNCGGFCQGYCKKNRFNK